MKFKDEKSQYEYEKLLAYETELTKSRWTVFAVLFSVSLLIPGIALRGVVGVQSLDPWAKYAIAFGFLVYLTATYHYWWYHRISHRIRAKLKEIEENEGIVIMKIRERPKIGPFKIHFHWMIWILGLAYALLTYLIVGTVFFLYFIGGLIISIFILAVIYSFLPVEPLEADKK